MWEEFFRRLYRFPQATTVGWALSAIHTENFRRLSFSSPFSWAKPTLQYKPIRQKGRLKTRFRRPFF
ncbi:hypothetical protein NEIMUCOT_03931 [Neisseria mucosa ATCC 25996]|uniref:Uncharacterized protein n=1 Tax=Neisseria mucosa (strain ATCC 25996 / DSM 4631 / NCTC 10774 / M26) TaxID=546266 RepID=D2ZTJ5_NEIM2|nr:hypothetical protein NEIMUCOT_03931 [Neisseria mucosa ATCC 25996]